MTASTSAGRADRPHFHINAVDRLLLRGRDPYRPVYLIRFVRLQYALLAAVLIAVVGVGYIAWAGQQKAHRVCLQRNQSSVVYREALNGLADAAAAKGDRRSAAIFKALAPTTPLPDC